MKGGRGGTDGWREERRDEGNEERRDEEKA